jgi:hypothetical protein
MPKERKDAMFLPKAPPPKLHLPLPLVSLTRYTPPLLLHARAMSNLMKVDEDEVDDDETGFNSFGCVSLDASSSAMADASSSAMDDASSSTLPRRAALPIQSNHPPSQ